VETDAGGPAIAQDGDLIELSYSAPDSPAGAPIRFTLMV
jgi:hypothetical protein